jgi:ribose 5-phosphate isomerase A
MSKLTIVMVKSDHADLHELIQKLDKDLLKRYPADEIYLVDFSNPKVKEMIFTVVYMDAKPVAWEELRPIDAEEMELKRFYVDPSYRRQGIAVSLLSFLEDEARKRGILRIKLETGVKRLLFIRSRVTSRLNDSASMNTMSTVFVMVKSCICLYKTFSYTMNSESILAYIAGEMSMNLKQKAAEKAVEAIQDGMKVGLGTGSTAYWAIQKIGERVAQGLHIQAVATSQASEDLARELGIPIIPFDQIGRLDVTIDGADEVNEQLVLVKGGGGALLREKIVESNSDRLIIIVDESKDVKVLGAFPLPVEVVPFASEWTLEALRQTGCQAEWRIQDGELYLTDNGNYIADCRYGTIENPQELEIRLNQIPGVVENGLFIHMADQVIIARANGQIDIRNK